MDEPSRRTLQRVLKKTGAKVQLSRGDSEDLLSQIEQGKLDLVFGEFPRSSPWKKAVHFGSAQGRLGKPPKDLKVPRFAMMNGENGWIMLIEKASK
ncbi:substrate-binding domain-containing protein [Qipengyuania sp. YG27]|uniref:Substrate-binding domain-containing protein n=1 Tax=Qipengyuania mesophila TaxID=2867246 RepID=A0ABS7JS34_9SPHN|nr:substrate-binding domain-containing protein [Qipengyuania mesophila]MBX7500413.1 substrate-binding domain-containing protein [Qipengyuania mesophila]